MNTSGGWTGKILFLELPSGATHSIATAPYAEAFPGGRLLAARLYWDEVSAAAGALTPENLLMIMPGPLAGTSATACSRWVLCAKSPLLYPEQYAFANGGGLLGAALKRAGYDGLMIRGRADRPSYVVIENERLEMRDAHALWGKDSQETIALLQKTHGRTAGVACIGPAGEQLVRFASVCTDQGGFLSNGMGAVMGSKHLKAVVVKGTQKVTVAHPEKLQKVNRRIRFLRKGLNESVYMTEPPLEGIEFEKPAPCFGCPAGCMRAYFKHVSGRVEIRKTCASAFLYTPWDPVYHGKTTELPFLATSLCNRMGLCTGEMSNIMHWLERCFSQKVLTEAEAVVPLSKIGSREYIESLVDRIVSREGLGRLLGEGTRRASIELGPETEKLALERIMPSGYNNDAYGARVFLITALFYATEPRHPIIQLHEVNFLLLKWVLWHTTAGAMSPITTEDLRKIAKRAWGNRESVDFSTYDGKAAAAVVIQNREHAKEAMVACDRFFPLLDTDQQEDHMGDPALVPGLFQAVTGLDLDERGYLSLGERSVNLQRAIMAREGRAGREQDALSEFNFTEPLEFSEGIFGLFNPDLELPGKGNEIVSRKGQTVDREEFERMKDEYYTLRGWDPASGLQTAKKLQELGLSFVIEEMQKKGFLVKN